ncbi:hypothetical protein HPB48_010853 [Haemaphysalis longicornis]|uniref:G-protein coupled receptors family 2 profile 2 domain-containing protein n=1 Tax=Haemaphysalis longicornis TaxID=44386 RepID=A0A9J6GLN9_HAELO|nr:hypothetical protein HPB48_010853 [Haemaphysalis longicornis]
MRDTVAWNLYRNLHCAICNSRSPYLSRCGAESQFMGKATPPSNFAGVSYAVVLDFSNWHALPQQRVNNTCGRDKIYDPLSKTCVQTSCPADVCVQRDDCLWTRFSRDEITFREDLSLIITSTSEQLNPDRWHRDGPDIVVCMSTKSGATAIEPIGFEEVLSNVTLFISALCLTLHIITYALLPQLRNGHSRIVLCLAVSLLVAQGTFLGSGLFLRAGMALCTACAVVSHASHLAAFFWMNVMAMDLQRTFQKTGIGKSRAQGAFQLYSAYAWMVPVALVAAALILQDLRPSSPFSPSYGRPHCWINRPFSLLAFFGAPVLLLLLANVVLFCLTAASIHQATKQVTLEVIFAGFVTFISHLLKTWCWNLELESQPVGICFPARLHFLHNGSILWYA